MPTPRKNITNDLENFDKDSVMTQERFIFLMQQRECNEVKLGSKVALVETRQGSEKKNKEGGFILDNNNEPFRYPDTYYAHLVFDGATLVSQITYEQSSSLIVGKRYYCEGRIGICRDYGKEFLAPIFSTFTELIG